ncbi:MAG TPA: universal stress protein [Polyangiaceae bacterium]|nr:universal stress protein [Polyangiaceae bacterium]
MASDVRRIMVPVDYSEHSLHALSYAAALAERFSAELLILHVWDQPSYVPETITVGPPGAARPLGDLIRENAEKEMQEFLARASLPRTVQSRHKLVSGEPASAVLKCSEHESPDLIVMGTHGRTGMKHLLLGSVAEKVVRLSAVPVITVPPPDRGKLRGS